MDICRQALYHFYSFVTILVCLLREILWIHPNDSETLWEGDVIVIGCEFSWIKIHIARLFRASDKVRMAIRACEKRIGLLLRSNSRVKKSIPRDSIVYPTVLPMTKSALNQVWIPPNDQTFTRSTHWTRTDVLTISSRHIFVFSTANKNFADRIEIRSSLSSSEGQWLSTRAIYSSVSEVEKRKYSFVNTTIESTNNSFEQVAAASCQ